MITFGELCAIYKRWVVNNPVAVTDLEIIVTWLLYYVIGKIKESPIVSELVFLLSNLVVSFNDRLISYAYGTKESCRALRKPIVIWLTIIYYCEVFVELFVVYIWGNIGKWTVVTVLQLFKCSLALILLYRFKKVPIAHPPIPISQRNQFIKWNATDQKSNVFCTLRRYGRRLLQVGAAPLTQSRNSNVVQDDQVKSSAETKELIYAETLHILRPLIHLAAMRAFGTKAWMPWLVALGIDITSMTLFNKHMETFTDEQRSELSRRKMLLLVYLFRIPMYNDYSKYIIKVVLTFKTKIHPVILYFMSLMYSAIIKYLNYCQGIYFYIWSS